LRLPGPYNLRDDSYVHVSGGWRSYDYLVAPGVGERMLAAGWISGKKYWGFTDNADCAISEGGRRFMIEVYAKCGVPYDWHFTSRLRVEQWLREVA
jgi:hypothetical protein